MGVAYYHKDQVNSKTHLHTDLADFMLKNPNKQKNQNNFKTLS